MARMLVMNLFPSPTCLAMIACLQAPGILRTRTLCIAGMIFVLDGSGGDTSDVTFTARPAGEVGRPAIPGRGGATRDAARARRRPALGAAGNNGTRTPDAAASGAWPRRQTPVGSPERRHCGIQRCSKG